MAGYRQIHTKIWKDEYFIELSPDEKLVFIYLFSNELTSISGIYKIPTRVISNETGLDHQFILGALEKFETDGKIAREDGIIWVIRMQEYHSNASPTTMKKVMDDISKIPDIPLKKKYLEFYQGMDTVSTQYRYPNTEDKAKEKTKDKSKSETEKEPVNNAQTLSNYDFVGEFLKASDIPGLRTNEQGDQIVEFRQKYGDAVLMSAAEWLKEKKITNINKAISSLRTALPNWTIPDKRASPKSNKAIFERNQAVIAKVLADAEVIDG